LVYLEDCDLIELCMVNSYFNTCFGDTFWRLKFFELDNSHTPATFIVNEDEVSWKYLYFQKKDRLVSTGAGLTSGFNNNFIFLTLNEDVSLDLCTIN